MRAAPRFVLKRLLPLIYVVLAGAAHAQPPQLLQGNESAAATDDALGFLFNPAAGGIRYPSELTLGVTRPEPGGNDWMGALSGNGMGFAFEELGPDFRRWTLASHRGDEQMRIGARVQWLDPRGSGTVADYALGALSRPHPWLSLGATAEHLLEPRVLDASTERTWGAAVGFRPLALDRVRAFDQGPRLTLTADASWRESDAFEDGRLRLGGEIEFQPGIVVRGAIENHRGWQLGVGLLSNRSSLSGSSAYNEDGARLATTWMASLHRGEERTVVPWTPRRVAALTLGGMLADEAAGGSLLGDAGTASAALAHRTLERALEDPLTRGVLLELRGVSGTAQLEELRPRIQRLRAAGKPVVAYLEYGGGRGDLFLASACDRVVASEEAFFAGMGLRAERRSYRSALERLGVRMDRASIGRYKSAWRAFSVDSTTDADQESIEHLLNRSSGLFDSTVAAGRGVPIEHLAPAFDGRAWESEGLAALGVLDSVGYREDALRILGRLAGLGDAPPTVNLARTPRARRAWTVPHRIAVVYASGDLANGRSANDVLMGATLGSETYARAIEHAFRHHDVGAVVLRIESPGGLVTASNLMHHAAERWKRTTGKPLIVSMGRVAASGGYYMAVPADRIFANRATATGSIGVVFVKPSLEQFYAKHGVRQESWERGDFMRGTSLASDWDARIQAAADSSVARSYEAFLGKVAAGRGLPLERVREVAQGRVWTGADAVALGLVDEIGGLEAAIAEARRRARVPQGERIAPLEYRRPRGSLIERVLGSALRSAWDRTFGASAALEGPAYVADEWSVE